MPLEPNYGLLDDPQSELAAQRLHDNTELRLLITALPNGDPDSDPQQYINVDAQLPACKHNAEDLVLADDDGPDGDIGGDTPESSLPSSPTSSCTDGSEVSSGTEETLPGMSPAMALHARCS